MEIKKNMNKVMKEKYADYKRATATELWEVYGRYSHKKAEAMKSCRTLCYDLDGYGLRIISANKDCFSVGFEFPHPETGVVCFAYITKSQNRFCEVE